MPTSLTDLIAALPDDSQPDESQEGAELSGVPASPVRVSLSLTPVPISRMRRFTALGTLQAKIGAAYLFHWLRGWFRGADERKRLLAETHWRTALRLMDSMTYLRGAIMKVGQTLANFPDIAPRAFVETLERLHFNAPPMHWSLLREMVNAELGNEPRQVFSQFDERAFAAASLGQVHRAQLPDGTDVAVKIQYPGIARTIEADFRNLFMFLLPARLSEDWENTKDQFEDIRVRLEQEADYVSEATYLEQARRLFHPSDEIVIPQVFPEFSTQRVLTMQRLEGQHLSEFVARDPPQEERNEVARKMLRAWYRMMYAGRLFYVDFHPGNFLVLPDGRLGVIDFGSVMPLDDEEWELYRRVDRPLTTGRREDRIAVLKEWSDVQDDEVERMELLDEFAVWSWMSRYQGGEYDFGNEEDFRRGVDLFTEMVRKRYSRARPTTPTTCRCQFGWRAMFYLLKAKIDVRSIAEQEIQATGWDRSDYAPPTTG
jgi:predicted unusual protein kinase regulating ubiquinone biosynthesis (AarF/ABC1/UbiB family)